MDLEQEALDKKWDEVRQAELAEIAVRRVNAGLAEPHKPADDLVGLALSGGGIRSASFNLGVLQALVEYGFFRYVDLLSTVSGGGYIGSFISSLAYRQNLRRTLAKDTKSAESGYLPPPIAQKDDSRESEDTRSLAQNSNFLNDKLEFASRYLIGWFLNFITIFSCLVVAATVVALVWRCLDMPFVVDFLFLYSRGWIQEWNRPFLPALAVFGLWCLSWAWSSFWKGNLATARHSGKLLALAGAFFLVGAAIWLGTPNMNLHKSYDTADIVAHESFWNAHQHWLLPISIAWAVTLLPFLNPRELVKSGTDTKSAWKGWLFHIAGYGMIVGIPFATIYFIGRHNVSGVANGWQRNIVASDIVDWEKFWKQVRHDYGAGEWPGFPLLEKMYIVAGYDNKLFNYTHDDTELYRLQKPSFSEFSDQTIGQYYTDIHARNQMVELMNKAMDDDLIEPLIEAERMERLTEWKVNRYSILTNDLRDLERTENFAKLKFHHGSLDMEGTSLHALTDAIRTIELRVNQRIAKNLAAGPAKDDKAQEVLAKKIADDLEYLKIIRLVNEKIEEFAVHYPFLTDVRKRLRAIVHRPTTVDSYALDEARALMSIIDEYRFYSTNVHPLDEKRFKEARELWRSKEYDKHAANHLLLRLFYPQNLRPIQFVSRPIVIMADQLFRLKLLLLGGAVFIVLGLVVNFNWTSMHGFYRRRIQRVFLVRHAMTDDDQEHREIKLQALANVLQGYAYHILTGCVELRTGDPDVPPRLVGFQFSRLYCGGKELDFCDTKSFRAGLMTLSSAAAISGAALSPTRIRYLLLQIMLTVTNLRLGQWLPNPTKNNALTLPPRYVPLLRLALSYLSSGETRDQSHLFVTDGGHYENLGIDILLDRRCRLIVASDAGADPEFQYVDLANLFALARRKGIRFVQFNAAAPSADEEISLESVQQQFKTGDHLALWKIKYPEKDSPPGFCVYIKSSVPTPQPFDAGQYKLCHDEFPHDSTINQFFHEEQFEVYRSLGYRLARNMLERLHFKAATQGDKPIDAAALLKSGRFE